MAGVQGEILAGAGVGVRKKSGLTGAPAVKFLCGLIDIETRKKKET